MPINFMKYRDLTPGVLIKQAYTRNTYDQTKNVVTRKSKEQQHILETI